MIKNTIYKLASIASDLDSVGLTAASDSIDELIQRLAGKADEAIERDISNIENKTVPWNTPIGQNDREQRNPNDWPSKQRASFPIQEVSLYGKDKRAMDLFEEKLRDEFDRVVSAITRGGTLSVKWKTSDYGEMSGEVQRMQMGPETKFILSVRGNFPGGNIRPVAAVSVTYSDAGISVKYKNALSRSEDTKEYEVLHDEIAHAGFLIDPMVLGTISGKAYNAIRNAIRRNLM